jgi:hypothetical protein
MEEGVYEVGLHVSEEGGMGTETKEIGLDVAHAPYLA